MKKIASILFFYCIAISITSCDKGPTSGKAPSEYSISLWGEKDNGELLNGNFKLEITYSDQVGEEGVDGYVMQSIEIPKSIYPTVWHSRYNDIGMYLSFTNTTQDTLFVVFTNAIDLSQSLDNVFSGTNNDSTSIDDVLKDSSFNLIHKIAPGDSIELEY